MTAAEQRKILALRQEGYGYKRIASVTGMSISTIKSFLIRHPEVLTEGPTTGQCKQCGDAICNTPHKRQKQFCSDACRIAWWNAHGNQLKHRCEPITRKCPLCGVPFEAYGKRPKKYCSQACYIRWLRKDRTLENE